MSNFFKGFFLGYFLPSCPTIKDILVFTIVGTICMGAVYLMEFIKEADPVLLLIIAFLSIALNIVTKSGVFFPIYLVFSWNYITDLLIAEGYTGFLYKSILPGAFSIMFYAMVPYLIELFVSFGGYRFKPVFYEKYINNNF